MSETSPDDVDSNNRKTLFARAWSASRRAIGWFFLVAGLILAPLPPPLGVPMILVAVVLLGPRNRVVRWLRVHLKLTLRWLSRSRQPRLRKIGLWGNRVQAQFTKIWQQQKSRKKPLRVKHDPTLVVPAETFAVASPIDTSLATDPTHVPQIDRAVQGPGDPTV